MGKFKVIVSDKAKKDLLEIQRSGGKASIKRLNKLFQNYTCTRKQARESLNG